MAPIRNQEESDFINNFLPFNSKYYWIGIIKREGEWVWEKTDEKVPEDAQNWAAKEPDNIVTQDCVEIYIKRGKDTAKWNNENCQKRKGTVCYTGYIYLFMIDTYTDSRCILACEKLFCNSNKMLSGNRRNIYISIEQNAINTFFLFKLILLLSAPSLLSYV